MTETDEAGAFKSYLASEERFAVVKNLESKNLVIPVVGDFGGPKAIRAVGAYLKARGATVSTFYLSNVEQYLEQDRKWSCSAATSRRCRSIGRARSSDRRIAAADLEASAPGSCRGWARWPRKRRTAGPDRIMAS